jgi:hypothetical protein
MRAWARPARIGVALTLLVAACGGGRSDIDFGFPPEAAGGSIGSAGASGSSQTGGLGGSAQGGIGGSAQGGLGGSAQGGIGGAPDGGFGGAPDGGFGGAGAEGGFGGDPAGAGGGPAGAGGVGGSDECFDQATTDCDVCVCQNCGGERQTCLDDGGCAAILRCVAESGCSGPSCYFGPCRQVIDDNGGPGGPAIALLQQVASCIGNSGCPCGGGAGGNGGNGGNGFGGNGFGGNAGNGFGGNGGAPGGCISCIAQNCPDAQQCFADQACRSGVICVATQCGIGGGGGGLQCVIGCFNGDTGAAIQGLQALQCVASSCGGQCGGPGGGFGGGPGGG